MMAQKSDEVRKYAPYTMFYYGDPDYVVNPGNVETKQSRNTITMSVT